MTEEENRPPPICGVFPISSNSNSTPNNDADYFYNSSAVAAGLYYSQVGHPSSSAAQFYERSRRNFFGEGVIDLSHLPEVNNSRRRNNSGSSTSAFRPVHPPGDIHEGQSNILRQGIHHFESSSNKESAIYSMKGKKYNSRYPLPEKPRQKRAVIQDMVRPLKQWLVRHRHNPYPTKTEKVQLALGSNMTLVQVSNWFANARRRLKNVVQDHRCSWSKRLRMYNQFVQGNAELLSIASDDSIWNSEDEEELCESSKARRHDEEDSCGRTPVSSADGNDERPTSSPSLGKDGSPKYKTSILHRYLADSLESAPLFQQHYNQKHSHLPIRPVPRGSKDDRLYKPYKVEKPNKDIDESSRKEEDDEDPLVVVDDDDLSPKKDVEAAFLHMNPTHHHLPHSFPHLWPHPAFPLANHLFSPFLASTPHKDLLKILYSDALLSRSKDLVPQSSVLGHSLPQEPISRVTQDFPLPHHPTVLPNKPPSEILSKLPPPPQTQSQSSTPAILI